MIRIELESEYGYFKANNSEEKDILKFYDSDGGYIESIYIDEFFVRDYFELTLALKDCNARYVAEQLKEIFEKDGVSVKGIFNAADFELLYEIYGKEFVNRIGDCALVINE